MNIVLRFAILFLVLALGASCRTSKPVAQAPHPAFLPSGVYVYNEAGTGRIQLTLKPDGTYKAAAVEPSGEVRHESGIWKTEGKDVVLEPRNGDLGHPIRRLRPDPHVDGRLRWIIPAGGPGVITYPFFDPMPR